MAADSQSGHEKSLESEDSQQDQRASEADQKATEQETKDIVVDWEGSDDPQNPRNWPTWKRLIQVVLVSLFLLTA